MKYSGIVLNYVIRMHPATKNLAIKFGEKFGSIYCNFAINWLETACEIIMFFIS